jgi:flagellar L-ring protein precursor FlgH
MFVLAALAVLGLSACSLQPVVMQHSPEFAPVYPVSAAQPRLATGGIYNGRPSDNWFGRGRAYQVGDIITVLLNESTQAARNQSTDVSRESENDAINTGILGKVQGLGSIMGGINLNGATIESSGAGTAAQRASLTGSIAATVTEVLANGNLVVRGEKQLALTEGMEIIQVSGIIRPEDVTSDNKINHTQIAEARISYGGRGQITDVQQPRYGQQIADAIMPF